MTELFVLAIGKDARVRIPQRLLNILGTYTGDMVQVLVKDGRVSSVTPYHLENGLQSTAVWEDEVRHPN